MIHKPLKPIQVVSASKAYDLSYNPFGFQLSKISFWYCFKYSPANSCQEAHKGNFYSTSSIVECHKYFRNRSWKTSNSKTELKSFGENILIWSKLVDCEPEISVGVFCTNFHSLCSNSKKILKPCQSTCDYLKNLTCVRQIASLFNSSLRISEFCERTESGTVFNRQKIDF